MSLFIMGLNIVVGILVLIRLFSVNENSVIAECVQMVNGRVFDSNAAEDCKSASNATRIATVIVDILSWLKEFCRSSLDTRGSVELAADTLS